MRPLRSLALVVFGILAMLALGEVGVRVFDETLPRPPEWPTVESEIKADQIRELGSRIELLVLGSSITEAAVDPVMLEEEVDLHTYNTAMPFLSPSSYETWLSDLVYEVATPDVVVIGVRGWPSGRGSRSMRLGLESALSGGLLEEVAEGSALYSRRGVLADWDRLSARERIATSGRITPRGHQTGYYGGRVRSFADFNRDTSATSLSPMEESALLRVIEMVRDTGATAAILIEPGLSLEGSRSHTDRGHLRWLKDKASEWDVPIWDTFSMDWEESMFADSLHFNREGTEAYTRHLSTLVRDLISHRRVKEAPVAQPSARPADVP